MNFHSFFYYQPFVQYFQIWESEVLNFTIGQKIALYKLHLQEMYILKRLYS